MKTAPVLVLLAGAVLTVAGWVLFGRRAVDPEPVAKGDPIRQFCAACHIYPEPGTLPRSSWKEESLSSDFEMSTMKAARDSINVATLIDSASRRFPFINERTPMSVTHGIMTFTPDGHALCGPATDIQGKFHCTGFCGRGVFQSTCIGVVMAELILESKSRYDVAHLQPNRFSDNPIVADVAEIKAQCYRRYAGHYDVKGESEKT